MGYKIRVDHEKLSNAAKRAKSFVSLNRAKINNLNVKVSFILRYWQGSDATVFADRWLDISSKYSVSGKMNTAIKNYANCLDVAAKKYKKAQADAINRANRLR